jgi:hypothetical protein
VRLTAGLGSFASAISEVKLCPQPTTLDAIPFNRSRVHQISMLLCSYICNQFR